MAGFVGYISTDCLVILPWQQCCSALVHMSAAAETPAQFLLVPSAKAEGTPMSVLLSLGKLWKEVRKAPGPAYTPATV